MLEGKSILTICRNLSYSAPKKESIPVESNNTGSKQGNTEDR